jgi:hypothetical protein
VFFFHGCYLAITSIIVAASLVVNGGCALGLQLPWLRFLVTYMIGRGLFRDEQAHSCGGKAVTSALLVEVVCSCHEIVVRAIAALHINI